MRSSVLDNVVPLGLGASHCQDNGPIVNVASVEDG